MSYRFHLPALPHTQTVKAYSNCAFTDNIRKFCMLLKHLGHEVILYGAEENDAPCDEFVPCMSKALQHELCDVTGPQNILNASWEKKARHWRVFRHNVVAAMKPRVRERDFLGLIAGDLMDGVIEEFPKTMPIEYAVGYTGISMKTHRVFASSNWMHAVYGKYFGAHGTRGRFYDRVIPHFIDLADFTYSDEKDDYFLFVGRLNEDKGVHVASQVCEIVGKKLVVCGQGPNLPKGPHIDHRGLVGPTARAELMSRAKAVFVPSLYLEPFGMVAIEALASGTPIITTDWGGLREINENGVTGFRCHTLRDFVLAAERIGEIQPSVCRNHGERYSYQNLAPLYQKWFDDLNDLWGAGWATR